MMGLFRKAIVLGAIIFVMPSPPSPENGGAAQSAANSSTFAYVAAAVDTLADMKGFCERKPQVCTTAQYFAVTFEGKAKYGAKLIYEWANETAAGRRISNVAADLAAADLIKTGSTPRKLRGSLAESSTLTMQDLLPEWKGTLKPDKS